MCIESGTEASVRASVSFGIVEKATDPGQEANSDQQLADQERQDEAKQMRSEQDDIFDLILAASRNPNEQNRRETLMANLLNQDARKIMKKAYATRRERLQRERGEFKNWRDVITWNKQDAGYWRRLNAF